MRLREGKGGRSHPGGGVRPEGGDDDDSGGGGGDGGNGGSVIRMHGVAACIFLL